MSREPPRPDGSSLVEPGQVTALLVALAAAPVEEDGPWSKEPLPGEQVDRYRLLRRIGRGGFGVVFEARDEVLGRLVALKLVRNVRHEPPGSGRLFMEAEAAVRLSHPNIVTLFDVGRCDRGPYLVLELLRGESLASRLARGPVPLPEAVRIAGEVAKALAHAHGHAVVHRDLKPGNAFLCEDGQVKVLDFGMAHAFGLPRVDGGTPAYMAPEQRSGAPEDERTDVYALGVTLYQLLTGKLPYGDDGRQHAHLSPARLAIPEAPELSELVHRMLERDPVRRPRNGADAVKALESVSSSLQAAPAGPSQPVRLRRRWPQALAVAAASIAGALLLRWAWPAPTAPPAATGRPVLAMADIANETGEPELELSGLLRTVLEQSTFLEVLPRGRLLDALPVPPGGAPVKLGEEPAQAAARSVHARSLLLVRLLRLGANYLVEVRAIDPASGARHFSFTVQDRGKESLYGLLDRVGERVRLQLGEDPAAIRKSTIPAGQVTQSLEAWSAYSTGLACFEQRSFAGTFGRCLTDMERAVVIDPGFALAHLHIAVLRFFEGKPLALQQEAVRQAQAHADRVPRNHRQRLEGWAAYLHGRDDQAKTLLRAAAEASPDDKLAWYLAGEVPYHRDEFAEALPLFRRAYALDPGWLDSTQHLILTMGVAGDLDGVGAMARELGAPGQVAPAIAAACYAQLWTDPARAVDTCQKVKPADASEATDGLLAVALLYQDRRHELGAHLDAMKEAWGPSGFARAMRLWLLGQEGRWEEVARVATAEGNQEDVWFHSEHAELFAGAGDAASVGQEALRIIETNRTVASNLAVHLAYLGDLRRAAELERYLPPGSPRVEAYRALLLWRTGDLQGAIASLRSLAARSPVSADPAIPPPLYLLGEALAEAGKDGEAVDALRRFRRIPQTYPTWFWPRSQWFLARSLDRMGNLDGAREVLAPLLKLWAQASAQQPHLAEARALGQRLGLH